MADSIFPSTVDPSVPAPADANKIFPTLPDQGTATTVPPSELSESYVSDLASRWSRRTQTPYGDMVQIIRNVGPDGVLNTPKPVDATSEVIDYGFKNNLSPEELKSVFNDKLEALNYEKASAHNADIVETKDPAKSWREQTVEAKTAFLAAATRDELNRINKDSSLLSSAADYAGVLAYESTIGLVARGTGVRKTKAEDFYARAMSAASPEEMVSIVKEAVREGQSRSLFGNAVQGSLASEAFLDAGTTQNEGVGYLLEVGATVGAPIFKGATAGIRGAVMASGSMAVRDAVDIAALSSVAAADTSLAHGIQNGVTSIQYARNGSLAASRVGLTGPANVISPTSLPVMVHARDNYILKNILESHWGSARDPVLLEQLAKKTSERVAKDTNFSYQGHTISAVDELGTNQLVRVQLGKDTGGVFTSKTSAAKAAKIVNGTVLEKSPKEFVVIVDKALSTKGTSSIIEESDLIHTIFASIVSPDVVSKQSTMALLKQGDARISFVLGNLKPFVKTVKAISGKAYEKERARFGVFMKDLSASGRNMPYTRAEFEQQWFIKHNQMPDPKISDLYVQTTYLNDASWLLHADEAQKLMTQHGVEVFEFAKAGEFKVIPRDVGSVADSSSTMVKDLTTGELVPLSYIKENKLPLFEVAEDVVHEEGDIVKYVTGEVKNNRPLTKHDALPYNPGGMQESTLPYYVKQSTSGTDISGNAARGMPRLIYNTATENAARKAITEINNIVEAVQKAAGVKGFKTFMKNSKDMLPTSTTKMLDDLIRANNSFNPSIESLDDFIKMSKDTGMDWTSPLAIGKADQAIGEVDGVMNRLITNRSTYADVFRHQHNTYGDKFKTVVPYGVANATLDPIKAAERDFLRVIHTKGETEYLQASIEGIIKGAEKNGLLKNTDIASLKNSSIRSQIQNLEIDTSTTAGKKYENVRQTLLRKLDEKSAVMKGWEYLVNKTREYVFDKGVLGMGKGKNWSIWDKFNKDPIVALRGWAFDQKLGMFALDQLIVQTSQIPNIIAISPKHGLLGLSDVPALRIALAAENEAMVKLMGKNIAKTVSAEEATNFQQLVHYVKKSGKNFIGSNIAEQNAAQSIGWGAIQKTRELGRAPFNEGERITRLVSIATAYREWRAVNPTLSVMTKEGMASADNFIMQRADALTSHMTGASAAVWQKGILSIPTQFLAYPIRNLEQVVFGHSLSTAESRRLALSQLVMYGLTATGAGWTVDKLIYDTNTPIDPDLYTYAKLGLMDGLIGSLTGVRTAYAERFSWGAGFLDMWRSASEKKFAEVAGGPVGQTMLDTGEAIFNLIHSVATGTPTSMKNDAYKLGLNFSGMSRIAKAWMIHNTGEVRSKDGKLRTSGLTSADAIAIMAGAKLQVDSYQSSAYDLKSGEDTYIKETGNKVRELRSMGLKLLQEGKDAEAHELYNQAAMMESIMTPYQLNEVQKYNREYNGSLAEYMVLEAQKRGHSAFAQRMRELTNQSRGIE